MPSFKNRLNELYAIEVGIESIHFTLSHQLDIILEELKDEQNLHVVVFSCEPDDKCLKRTG